MSNTAPIGITMGDPAGVGPEIICKALAEMQPDDRAATVVIGDLETMERARKLVGADFSFTTAGDGDGIRLVDIPVMDRNQLQDGQVSAAGGDTAFRCVARAAHMAMDGEISVIVTAPLNKAALHEAGHKYDGHTGMLAALTGAKSSFMLLASETLSTIHTSTHVSLRDATERATPERVLATIRAGNAHLKDLGLPTPRIAVAGLNPHCGEGGIFGREEIDFNPRRHGILPRPQRRIRPGRRPVSRPGPHTDQADRLRYHRQYQSWPADQANVGRPWHSLRHRLDGPRGSRQHELRNRLCAADDKEAAIRHSPVTGPPI
jgi:hypothetical protein